MTPDLGTTNTMLAIMAAVAVLEALVLIALAVGGFLMYRRTMQLVSDLEARQIAPIREKVDAILGDVKTVTARVSQQTERVDQAISGTMHRVDDTAARVGTSVRDKINQAAGVVRSVRSMLTTLLGGDKPPAPAAGRY